MQPNYKNHFGFHQQNEALLLQFLLHESLSAHSVLRQKPCPNLLSQVTGPQNHELVWQNMLGHLPKLRYYCGLFIKHFGMNSINLSQELHQSIERAQKAAKKCSAFHEKTQKEQKDLYQALKREVVKIIKLLLHKMAEYKDNPSILLFLLRHRAECHAAYRQPIVKNLFESLFPEGKNQAYAFLSNKLSQRGFDHLIPSIENYLNQLEIE